jgi:hypothetical protein
MTTIATFTVPEDAYLFRAFLESRGIEGFVLDEHFVQLFWYYSNAIGGVRVVVEEADVEEAIQCYRDYTFALRAGVYPVRPVRAWPVVVLLSIAFGLPFLILGRRAVRSEVASK